MFGRTVRGPMMVLKELWTKEVQPEVKTSYQYVLDLKDRLSSTCELVRHELQKSSDRYKKNYDRKASNRSFKVGDYVLILLQTDSNKLLMQWKGPFKVVERTGISDYRIDVNGKLQLFHANLLKKYNLREEELKPDEHTQLTSCAVIENEGEDGQGNEQLLNLLPIKATQSFKDRDLTSFLTPDGLYKFKVMPFGMSNSTATFNRLMRKELKDLKHTVCFLDDILIHTDSFEEHLLELTRVLGRLRQANLTAKPSKCEIGQTQLLYLGHIIGEGILKPAIEKLKAVEDAPRPSTKKEVRSFLGLLGYY